jgi:hypothetical protein
LTYDVVELKLAGGRMKIKYVQNKEQEEKLKNGLCPECGHPVEEGGKVGSSFGEKTPPSMKKSYKCKNKKCDVMWIIGEIS